MALTMTEKIEYIARAVEYGKEHPFVYLGKIHSVFPEMSKESLKTAVQKLYGVSAEEYFAAQGALLTPDTIEGWVNGELAKLAERYKTRKPAVDKIQLAQDNLDYDITGLRYAMHRMVELQGGAAEPYGTNTDIDYLFVDAGIMMSREQSQKWADETVEKIRQKLADKIPFVSFDLLKKASSQTDWDFLLHVLNQRENFDEDAYFEGYGLLGTFVPAEDEKVLLLYEYFDSFDVDAFAASVGDKPLQDKKYKVTIDGKELSVHTYWAKPLAKYEPHYAYDAFLAARDVRTRQEVYEERSREDPNGKTEYADLATTEFDRNTPPLSGAEIDRRVKFINTAARFLSDDAVMEKIAAFAPKKKDGTFARNRITHIASAAMGTGYCEMPWIFGKAKDDETLNLYFSDRSVSDYEYETLTEDFLSTYGVRLGLDKYFRT